MIILSGFYCISIMSKKNHIKLDRSEKKFTYEIIIIKTTNEIRQQLIANNLQCYH